MSYLPCLKLYSVVFVFVFVFPVIVACSGGSSTNSNQSLIDQTTVEVQTPPAETDQVVTPDPVGEVIPSGEQRIIPTGDARPFEFF